MKIRAEAIVKIGGKEWRNPANGAVRYYLNGDIWAEGIKLSVSYYETGNVRSATLDGELISNARARRILDTKVFWEGGSIRTKGMDTEAGRLIREYVKGLVS